jgi:hypothetical protein
MKFRSIYILAIALVISASFANGEIYSGIGPLFKLADLKNHFPAANFTEEKPAWAQEEDVMYSITGQGITGVIVVKLTNTKIWWGKLIATETDDTKKQRYERFAERASDDLEVSWVRWIPENPFPVKRLITKYGKPEISDFDKVSYEPFNEWKFKGIQAFLSDDGKNVTRIDFNFTEKEIIEANMKAAGIAPEANNKKTKRKK